MRGFLWLLLCGILLSPTIELQAQITVTPRAGGIKELKIDTPAIARPTTPPAFYDISKADWVHFWMFDDGTFIKDNNVVERSDYTPPVGVTSVRRVKVATRGRYHGDQEPPPASKSVDTQPKSGTPAVLAPAPRAAIVPQWGAARLGDTVYMAFVMKNSLNSPQNGHLRVSFPTQYMELMDTVHNTAFLDRQTNQTLGAKTIARWTITNFPAATSSPLNDVPGGIIPREYCVFLMFKVKPVGSISPLDVTYSTTHLFEMDFDLSGTSTNAAGGSASEGSDVVKSEGKTGRSADSGEGVVNAVEFTATTSTSLAVNAARDPNRLDVYPQEIYPTNNSSDLGPFKFTMNVENLGNAPASHLRVKAWFDPLLRDPIAYDSTVDNHFPLPNTKTYFCPVPTSSPYTAYWKFIHANLAAADERSSGVAPDRILDSDKTMPQLNQASYDFRMSLQPNKQLRAGDQIVSKAFVEMFNANTGTNATTGVPTDCLTNFITEDTVTTAPCIIKVIELPKVKFGTVIGLKVHRFLTNADSIGSDGIGLTVRVPVFRPRFDNSRYAIMQRIPHWYWQFELGYVRNNLLNGNGLRYWAEGIQLTPIQLRGIQPVRISGRRFCVGVSAGYNIAYMYRLVNRGVEQTLPSGTKRLDHEVFGSIDFQNRMEVPTFTVGVGMKARQSSMLGKAESGVYPFVYAQIEIVRIRRGFARVWNSIYRW
jgi:hypothetical protein